MSIAMSADEQLRYEARTKPRQAVIAALAAVLLVAAAAIQLAGTHTKVNELTLDLITAHKRFPLDLIGAIVNGLGLAMLAATLVFVFRITHARNPALRTWLRWLALGGGLVAGLTGIVYAVVIASKASTFVSHGAQTYQEANHLTSAGGLLALPFLGQAAALTLAVGFVLISLNAMRVGLLTRFMGYLGIFTGILVLFPIGSPVPVVQAFWLLALAYLMTDRWPSGMPPSWASGQAEPWPSAAAQREQRMQAGGRGGGGRGPAAPTKVKGKPAPAREDEPAENGATGARTRAATPKRKRKRRR
jgi:hypothetical protein